MAINATSESKEIVCVHRKLCDRFGWPTTPHGRRRSRNVHVLGPSGHAATATGRPQRSAHPLVDSDASRSMVHCPAESSPTGSFTSVPCACGTRTASPCPPSTARTPHRPPCRAGGGRPSAQKSQVLSAHMNGATTTSPRFSPDRSTEILYHAEELVTHAPALLGGRHRPVRPQVTQIRDRSTRARRRSSVGSGTSWTRTSPAPYITVARMKLFPSLDSWRTARVERRG